MKKGLVITLAVMLSLPFQTALAYADTAVTPSTATTPTTTSTSTSTSTPATSTSTSTSTTTTDTTTSSSTTTIPPVLDANGQPVSSGTLPDSPLYWLSNLIQKLQVVLTFDSVQKATLEENQALQKLAAARDMLQKGKGELAQKTLDEYTQKVQDAQKLLGQLQDPNSDSAKVLQTALAQTDAKNIQVLNNLLDKLPPQAAEKLAVNIVKSMQKTVDKMTTEQKNDVKAQIKETTKHMSQDNLDAQAAAALTQFQTALGVTGGEDEGDATETTSSTNGDNKTTTVTVSQGEQAKHQEQQKEHLKEQQKEQVKEQQKEQDEDQKSKEDQEDDAQKQDKSGTPTQVTVTAPTPAPATQPGVIPSASGQPQSSAPSLQAPGSGKHGESDHDQRDKDKDSDDD